MMSNLVKEKFKVEEDFERNIRIAYEYVLNSILDYIEVPSNFEFVRNVTVHSKVK